MATPIFARVDECRAALRLAPAERVRRGAELLDAERPGWHREVRPEAIRMGSNEDCLLGLLWGHVQLGREALGIVPTWPLGFDLPAASVGTAGYAELADLWRAEIEARGECDPPQGLPTQENS